MPVKKSAGAIVFHRAPAGKIEYLLLKHSEKYWNFPKGQIEKGESDIEAARREIEEETGLKNLRIISGFKAFEKYFYRGSKKYSEKEEGKTIMKIVVFYLAESKTRDVKISHEHQGYEWLDLESALERLKRYKGSRDILKRADNFLKKAF